MSALFKATSLWFLMVMPGISAVAFAQSDSVWVQKWAIPVADVKFYTTDHLLQTYLITASQEVIKYGPDGVEQFRYNNQRLGALARIDAANAFNLLLYYPDYQTAITLDRTLNKTGEWNLVSFGFLNVPIVATAIDNQLWLYDGDEQRLKKIGADGIILAQSDNLMQVLGFPLRPTCLLARGNFVYLSDPERGIVVFDALGQYHFSVDLKNIVDFQMLNEDGVIYYQQNGALWRCELRFSRSGGLALPDGFTSGAARFQVQRGHVFVLHEEGLQLFSLR